MSNAMLCCKYLGRYDEALKYANMLPGEPRFSRASSIEMCLQGEKLTEHRKFEVHRKLWNLLVTLSRIYYFSEENTSDAAAAMDATESILKAVISDGNYLSYYVFLCSVYEVRANFEIKAHNYDKAMEYLRMMLKYAKELPSESSKYADGVLDGLTSNSSECTLLYMFFPMDDKDKSPYEILVNRIKILAEYNPIRKRDDFLSLFE